LAELICDKGGNIVKQVANKRISIEQIQNDHGRTDGHGLETPRNKRLDNKFCPDV
jgi:hypothetical protein